MRGVRDEPPPSGIDQQVHLLEHDLANDHFVARISALPRQLALAARAVVRKTAVLAVA